LFEAKRVEDEIEKLLEMIFTRRQESLKELVELLSKEEPSLNFYLINRMVFIKFCQQDPLQLFKWVKQLSYFQGFGHFNFIAPLGN